MPLKGESFRNAIPMAGIKKMTGIEKFSKN
jgi:hypothetical protein